MPARLTPRMSARNGGHRGGRRVQRTWPFSESRMHHAGEGQVICRGLFHADVSVAKNRQGFASGKHGCRKRQCPGDGKEICCVGTCIHGDMVGAAEGLLPGRPTYFPLLARGRRSRNRTLQVTLAVTAGCAYLPSRYRWRWASPYFTNPHELPKRDRRACRCQCHVSRNQWATPRPSRILLVSAHG